MSASNKILVIVESPSKCKKIENYLGSEYKVIASYGHFTKLDDLQQINFEDFTIKYKINSQKVVKQLRESVKHARDVIIATDDDREGEAIGWTICHFCHLDIKKTKKITFQEITKTAILNALDNIHHIDMDRVKSQQARQILDIYLGYKISPMLWKYVQHKLSAGRCQTPALHLIYENQNEFDSATSDTEYKVNSNFTSKNILFSLTTNIEKENILEFIQEIKDKMSWTIDTTNIKEITEKSPQILITSSLQQKASNVLKMSPKTTMKCAQELYENGYITYMRTDSSCYSKDFIRSLKKHIEQSYGEKYLLPNIEQLSVNKSNGKAQEAHEGIRVCDLSIQESQLKNSSSNRLYRFIYKHCIQCGMAFSQSRDYEYFIQTGAVSAQNKEYIFKYKENVSLFDGWKLLETESNKTRFKNYLDTLFAGSTPFDMNYLEAVEKLISSPKHLSEASLIQQLEKRNIGRPSTFSSIIQNIQDKRYVLKGNIEGQLKRITNYRVNSEKEIQEINKEEYLNPEKGKLQITPLGKQVCEFCYQHFDSIFNYEFTNNMETGLDNIESREINNCKLLRDYTSNVDELIAQTKTNYENNPEQIKKICDTSLHCGKIGGLAAYIKSGKYGYYLCYGNNGKTKVSLKEFKGFNIEEKINQKSEVCQEELNTLIRFVELGKETRNKNILVELNQDYSIRESKYGFYLYYKTKKMKQPKFMKYNDEKDDKIDMRNEWIRENNLSEIKLYINQKYKINI
uniref:DNA topoisomerase n=1 Tax=viral metagenome TaxID=1070528 RepID=A0A6C0KWZ1_9ZZZZ|tara:strand:- start:2947 stop:5175 length:2229 start_codon:yes stop_codon:yes gene_type:complete